MHLDTLSCERDINASSFTNFQQATVKLERAVYVNTAGNLTSVNFISEDKWKI